MIEQITHKKRMLALIVRGRYRNKKGIHFFTPNSATQQFGYMKHKKKHIIKPHEGGLLGSLVGICTNLRCGSR